MAVGYSVKTLIHSFPLFTDLSAWYARPSWISFAFVALLLAVAFRISLGGRTLLKLDALDA